MLREQHKDDYSEFTNPLDLHRSNGFLCVVPGFFECVEAFFNLFQFVKDKGVYVDSIHTNGTIGAFDLVDQGLEFGFFFHKPILWFVYVSWGKPVSGLTQRPW